MREDQLLNPCSYRQFCTLTRSQMRELTRHFSLFIQISGFDHERICIFADLDGCFRFTGTPCHDEFHSLLNGTQRIVWLDAFTIRQSDLFTSYESTAFRSKW